MFKIKGYIPESIAIVSSIQRPVYRQWEDAIVINTEINPDDEDLVTPAFVSDSTNQRTVASAISWAERARQYYDEKYRKQVVKTDPVKQETRLNTPFENIRIVKLEYRGSGGRAYKVVTEDNYYYDLREDVMVEAMLKQGIRPGGYVNGKFIWARVNTTMKIVRVGSELHSALVSVSEKRFLPKIDSKRLIPGGLYEGKDNDRFVFIGAVDTSEYNYTASRNSTSQGALFSPYLGYTFSVTKRDLKNRMLWFNYPYRTKSYNFAEFEKHKLNTNQYVFMDKVNVVKLVEKFNIAPDHIEQLRSQALNDMQSVFSNSNATEKVPIMCMKARLACVRKVGESVPNPSEYQDMYRDHVKT